MQRKPKKVTTMIRERIEQAIKQKSEEMIRIFLARANRGHNRIVVQWMERGISMTCRFFLETVENFGEAAPIASPKTLFKPGTLQKADLVIHYFWVKEGVAVDAASKLHITSDEFDAFMEEIARWVGPLWFSFDRNLRGELLILNMFRPDCVLKGLKF